MDVTTQELVCREFRLGRPLACQRLGGTRNHNFRLQTGTGEWFVRRRFPGYSAPERIEFDHHALAFLAENYVAVIPPRRTISNGTFLKTEDVWEVFPFIAGREMREADAAD